MKAEDNTAYTIGLAPTRDLTGAEVAMHILAQTTRFVIRQELTPQQAAEISIEMANAFVQACNKSGEKGDE